MLEFSVRNVEQILCLGAHADDIEIGCGGALLKLIRANPGLKVAWVVLSGGGERTRESKLSAQSFLHNVSASKVLTKKFHISHFPFEGAKIKRFFETLKALPAPDLVFTHYREDRHQDHRMVSDLTWNTFRNHLILEYEIPKYDGDLGQPNLFVPLEEDICQQKVNSICRFFKTQTNKHWFSADTFFALMRLRGIECASQTKYAEAFYARKIVVGTSSVSA